jgi:hypothetical protein
MLELGRSAEDRLREGIARVDQLRGMAFDRNPEEESLTLGLEGAG